MINVNGVSKNFGKVSALRNISFEVQKGTVVGFLGQNGAGKTTLMRILTTYLCPSSGEVSIDGFSVRKDPMEVRKRIGYLPENPPLYPSMTVKDYLEFAAQLKDVPRAKISSSVDRVLEECRLKEVADNTIQYLSKGFKQRIGIAQAIIHDPQLIILDEPTNGLDPVQIQHVRELIKKLEASRTVIISTHILSEIEKLAHRVIIIRQGEIIADKVMTDFLANSSLEQVFLKLNQEAPHA
jgi:ABC-2 type transport system ATP-binding protein